MSEEYRSPREQTAAHVDEFLKRVDETIEGYIAHRQKWDEKSQQAGG